MPNAFAQRFQQVVDHLAQGSKKKFAEITGKSTSHIYKICRGSSRPSMTYLHDLYEAFSIDLNWLLTGQTLDGNSSVAGVNKDTDIVMTPMYNIQASAGYGTDVSSEEIDHYFAMDKQWLSKHLHISDSNLAFISIHGDSMEPTLNDGDDVLVDMSQKTIQNDNIYILHTDQGLMAKRLMREKSGGISVNSDNPGYDSWQIDPHGANENTIVGKVVWCTRRL